MCRFTFYRGPTLDLSSLLTEPDNSVIHQSYDARERAEPLNGDGFGVAWYEPDDPVPGLFRSISPAWSNQNLRHLARVVESRCILAHVRAASEGLEVIEPNCHPFVHDHLALMHNGEIGGFREVRRPLLAGLSDEAFHCVRGTTDTEHLFALVLDELARESTDRGCVAMAAALERAVRRVEALVAEEGSGEASRLNVLLSDGRAAVVTRYASEDAGAAETLHLSEGRRYACEDGVCRMLEGEEHEHAVLVSSEPLSAGESWRPVPENHVVLVSDELEVRTRPLEL